MRHASCVAVLLCLVSPVHVAFAEPAALGIELQLTRDTDGFEASRMRALGLARYENPWRFDGVAVQETRYREGAFRARGRGVLFQHRDQHRDTLAGLQLEAGAVRVGGRTRVVGEATLRLASSIDAPSYELVAARDWVETRRALERGITHALVGAGVEWPFNPHFSATAFAAHQEFSDGNGRDHWRGRLIWLVSEQHGLTAQLRYRGFSSERDDVAGTYFNPARYRQVLAVASVRRRQGHWAWRAEAGLGREHVDGRARPAGMAELRAEGAIAGPVRMELRAGYQRSAGSIVDDPDYSWRYAVVTLKVPLD